MKPGFFLKLADDTGDLFAYEILPAKEYKDIPLKRNPTVLVRCIVRGRDYGDDNAPLYRRDNCNFSIVDSKGPEVVIPEFKQEKLVTPSLQSQRHRVRLMLLHLRGDILLRRSLSLLRKTPIF